MTDIIMKLKMVDFCFKFLFSFTDITTIVTAIQNGIYLPVINKQ